MKSVEGFNWMNGVNMSFTYCDAEGIIREMNTTASESFSKYGGDSLIGESVLDCHPEPSRTKLEEMLKVPKLNVYTIEKNEQKKMIYQAPVMDGDRFVGIVEISLPLPDDMPHFIRS